MSANRFTNTTKDLFFQNGILVVILALIGVTGVIEPNFLTVRNLLNVLRQNAVIGIVACGMTYCIISGAYDLSVGSVVSLAGVITILSINAGVNEFLAILWALLAGAAVGLVNGTLISSIRGRSGEAFIITYGMQVVVASIALFPSNGLFISGKVSEGFFKAIGRNYWPIIIFLGIAVLMEVALKKTRYGRKMAYIGSNMNVAKMSGIRVTPLRISFFMISGLLSAAAGVLLCSRVTSSNPTAGVGFEMDAIAAVVVGGTSTAGGKGSVLRTVVGAIVIGTMGNALNILGITAYHQQIVKGMLIVVAVSLDIWNKHLSSRRVVHEKA
ncbi:MAG TPA: ABC transporter permease [Candidatus Limnocylindria bacterium]|nr:ABC transporter permease [Candidatus Limnocylindria bacterium]